jgi:nicotinamidase-related amidase
MPVLYTLITPLPKEYQSSWGLYSSMKRFKVDDPSKMPVFMAPGSREREIASDIAPHPGDTILEKPTANIFLGTNFETMMRNRGITTLLFTGIATEMGVEHSARDAAARGFYPVVMTDCVSSMDKEAHERSLLNMGKMFVLTDSDGLLKTLALTRSSFPE